MNILFKRHIVKAALTALLVVASQSASAATFAPAPLLPEPNAETAYLIPISIALDKGDYSRAESLVRERLALAPEDAIAWEVLGVALALNGNVAEADTAYETSVELDPRRLSAWVKRGDLSEAIGNQVDALVYWTAALKIAPAYLPAHQRLGAVYTELGDLPRALEHLETIAKAEGPAETSGKTQLALIYNSLGQPEDALALFDGLESAAATDAAIDPGMMLALGNAYAQLGNTPEAMTHYQRGIDAAPGNNDLLKAKGALLMKGGDAAGAVIALSKPAAADPVDSFANLQYARALLATGNPADAIAAGERAAGASATSDISLEALSLVARAHLLNKDFPAATDTTGRLVALMPDDPAAWREHAAIRGATGDYSAAKDIYDEALGRFGDDAKLLRGRSVVNVRLERLDAAAEDAQLAARADPNWLEPQFLLGQIERARGRSDMSEQAFRAALEINPDHLPSLVSVAMYRLDAGDRPDALKFAQRAVDVSGGAPAANALLEKVQTQ